jgi:hypothetical protein
MIRIGFMRTSTPQAHVYTRQNIRLRSMERAEVVSARLPRRVLVGGAVVLRRHYRKPRLG